MIKRIATWGLIGAFFAVGALAQSSSSKTIQPEFTKPQMMKADGKIIQVESPGHAAPCLADVTGDGKTDLLVGQFEKGKIKVYPGDAEGGFKEGQWLKAGGKTAEVAGVW